MQMLSLAAEYLGRAKSASCLLLMLKEWCCSGTPTRAPYLHTLHFPSHRSIPSVVYFQSLGVSGLVPSGRPWQGKKDLIVLSACLWEKLSVIDKEVHEGDIVFAAEVFFPSEHGKTCEFLAESNVLNICTKPFIENVAQRLFLQHLPVWEPLSWCPFSLPQELLPRLHQEAEEGMKPLRAIQRCPEEF